MLRWLPLGGAVDAFGDQLTYPAWLAGTWDVQYKKDSVRFPKGWQLLTVDMPGVSMGSILRLPNVGASPLMKWRFAATDTGSRADWAYMIPEALRAFETGANQSSFAAPVQYPGRAKDAAGWSYSYLQETIDKRTIQRNVTLSWLAANTWQDEDGNYAVEEWIRQRDDCLRNGATDYKVLTMLRRGVAAGSAGRGSSEGAEGFIRVEAFLQTLDPAYIEANGEAVAVFDYKILLRRPTSP